MPLISALQLKECKKHRETPVWLLRGGDNLLIRRAHTFLLEMFLAPEEREFNHDLLEGGSATAAEVISRSAALPFLGSLRVVTLREVRKLSADDQKKIAASLGKLPSSTRLILIDPEEGSAAGGKETLSKEAAKIGVVVDCQAPEREDLRKWIAQEVAAQGKSIEPVAASMLCELIGNDLNRLSLEIEKIILYMDDQPKITKALVQKLVSKSTEETVFRLTDAVAEKKVAVAMKVLEELMQETDNAYAILGMLTRHFRLLAQTQWLMALGYLPGPAEAIPQRLTEKLPSTHSILPVLKNQPWLARKLIQQAKLFSEEEIFHSFGHLLQADLSLKGISAPDEELVQHTPRMTMQLLVMQLCGVK